MNGKTVFQKDDLILMQRCSLTTKSASHEPILSPRGKHENCYYISHQVMSYFKKERVRDGDKRGTEEGRECKGEKTGMKEEKGGGGKHDVMDLEHTVSEGSAFVQSLTQVCRALLQI